MLKVSLKHKQTKNFKIITIKITNFKLNFQ